jgi:thiol:disulfide interchange protein
MVQELKNKTEFHNALKAHPGKLIVIDFYAQWVSRIFEKHLFHTNRNFLFDSYDSFVPNDPKPR